jgi:MoxR-like ATPase
MDLDEVCSVSKGLIDTIARYFVGDRVLLQKLLAASYANGHVLFEDYPGLGKTLLAKAFAKATGCDFNRIQFTPDLMPSDIVGTKVWKMDKSSFVLERGPVFTHILLADEINRSPPKVQSALLECMEERQVTIEGETHRLSAPFLVLATQNPLELEGTYPLPEAQMDRFMVRLSTGYVKTLDLEAEILKRRASWHRDSPIDEIPAVTSARVFSDLQQFVEEKVYVDDEIFRYIAQVVRATRDNPRVEVGSSPRGGISLFKLSKANAAINGRDYVIPDDVKLFARDALSHRIIPKIEYTLQKEVDTGSLVDEALSSVEVPRRSMRR